MTARHVPALDGVRGVAILLVLVGHLLTAPGILGLLLGVGRAGVDLFFVLSGYLITGILLDTRGRVGYARAFYARRALRIWPLYLAVIGGLALAAPWLARLDPAGVERYRATLPWLLVHAANLWVAVAGRWADALGMDHLWSLAVEEQFYLVWPLVVALIAPRRLPAVCAGLALASVTLRATLVGSGVPPVTTYVLPVTHLEPLMAGAWIASAARRPNPPPWLRAVGAWLAARDVAWWMLGGGAAALLLAMAGTAPALAPWMRSTLYYPAVTLTSGALVLAAVYGAPGAPSVRWLSGVPIRWLGTVSYGVYLVHAPLRHLTDLLLPATPLAVRAVAVVAVSCALAWASWRWWEGPWLSLKRYVPRPPASPAAA